MKSFSNRTNTINNFQKMSIENLTKSERAILNNISSKLSPRERDNVERKALELLRNPEWCGRNRIKPLSRMDSLEFSGIREEDYKRYEVAIAMIEAYRDFYFSSYKNLKNS